MVAAFITITSCYYIVINFIAVPGITLTSSPPPSSDGYYCPGPVQFTCVGTEIPALSWRINNTYRGTYEFFSGDTFPLSILLSPPLPDVTIDITTASVQNILSTLRASVSDLRGISIECSSFLNNISPQYESVQERQGTKINNYVAKVIIVIIYSFSFYLYHPMFHLSL